MTWISRKPHSCTIARSGSLPTLRFMENRTPQALREQAERALRLASWTSDDEARDALNLYARELLAEAALLEMARQAHRTDNAA